jgi:molybdate transport system substrate-binding protein
MAAKNLPMAMASDWTVGLRVWLEHSGRAVLGTGRLQLLEAIERWHSISAAARQIGMSYRRAWLLVQSINQAAGQPLVIAATGGNRGGGAELTPQGRYAVALFRELQGQLRQSVDSVWPHLVEGPGTASMHIAAAVSLEEALGQLLADFALQQPAVRIRAIFGASDELVDHLLAGSPADLFLTADARHLDRLEAARVVQPGTRTLLVQNTLAAIGPAGGALTVRKPRDLVRPAITRVALAETASPLGSYTRVFLESLGLYKTLLPHTVHVDNSRAVLATVRAGQADVGLVYGSDAGPASGCQLLFRVRRLPTPIEYTAAIVGRGRQPDQARSFLRFLASAAAASRFRHCGFLPVRGKDTHKRLR